MSFKSILKNMPRNILRNILNSILIYSFLTILGVFTNSGYCLTRLEAYEKLKENGLKWQLTKTLEKDAQIKLDSAHSKSSPQLALLIAEYGGKINPIQFGVDQDTINTVVFGTTAIQGRWNAIDSFNDLEASQAEAQVKISGQQAKQFQNELTSLMLFQYLTVQRLQRQLDALDASVKRSEIINHLAQTRQKIGAGIPLDIKRAKSLYESDRIKKIQAYTKYLKARHDLAATLGQESFNENLEPLKYDPIQLHHFKKLVHQSISDRPDLKAAQIGIEEAQKITEKSKSFIFPKLTLIGEIGSTHASLAGLGPTGQLTAFGGVMLEIPLETGGFITAKRNEALSLVAKATYQKQQVTLEVENQMKEAMEQLLAAEEAVSASQEFLKAAEEEVRISERRYSLGSSNIIEYSNSHSNLATAQDTETEAIYTYEAAKINFFKASGNLEAYLDHSQYANRSQESHE